METKYLTVFRHGSLETGEVIEAEPGICIRLEEDTYLLTGEQQEVLSNFEAQANYKQSLTKYGFANGNAPANVNDIPVPPSSFVDKTEEAATEMPDAPVPQNNTDEPLQKKADSAGQCLTYEDSKEEEEAPAVKPDKKTLRAEKKRAKKEQKNAKKMLKEEKKKEKQKKRNSPSSSDSGNEDSVTAAKKKKSKFPFVMLIVAIAVLGLLMIFGSVYVLLESHVDWPEVLQNVENILPLGDTADSHNTLEPQSSSAKIEEASDNTVWNSTSDEILSGTTSEQKTSSSPATASDKIPSSASVPAITNSDFTHFNPNDE